MKIINFFVLMGILSFSLTKVCFAIEIQCYKNNLPVKCEKLVLKLNDTVKFVVKAIVQDKNPALNGLPAFIRSNYAHTKQKSPATFTRTVEESDLCRGMLSEIFYVYDYDEVGAVDDIGSYDVEKIITLKTEKVDCKKDTTPAIFEDIKIYFEGKHRPNYRQLKLELGDTVTYVVTAATHDKKKPAWVKSSRTLSKRKSPATFTRTVKEENLCSGLLTQIITIYDGDNLGISEAVSLKYDAEKVISIPTVKEECERDKTPAKLSSLSVHAATAAKENPAKITDGRRGPKPYPRQVHQPQEEETRTQRQ